VLDNLSKGRFSPILQSQAEILEGDIRDESLVSRAVKGASYVVHLAAFGSVLESIKDPWTNFDINLRGTVNVLRAVEAQKIRRLVFASTGGAAVGNHEGIVTERSQPRPISPYGASKVAGEAYCHAFAKAYNLSIAALRFANVYGPFSAHKNSAVVNFMRAVRNGSPIDVYGDGGATRDFLYVDDLCEGIERALGATGNVDPVLHLASGVETSISTLIQNILVVARKSDHPVRFHPQRAGEVVRNVASYRLAEQQLGFKPKVSLKDGLQTTWNWFTSQEQ